MADVQTCAVGIFGIAGADSLIDRLRTMISRWAFIAPWLLAVTASLATVPGSVQAWDGRWNLNAAPSANLPSSLSHNTPVIPGAQELWAADRWHPAAGDVERPHGNPLTDSLDFSPAESELFADAADGQLHRLSLVDAALLACGGDDLATINQARQRFAAARDEAHHLISTESLSSDGTTASEREMLQRVQLIHQVLHQRLLGGGYNANATNLATTLQTGVYNCASATLLFVALAADLDVRAQAIELPGHVRAVVNCGQQRYEIEVTCPIWSGAVRRLDAAADLHSGGNENVGSAAEANREISPLGLVATIYYNRGIDAFNERRFAEALAANRRALLLDPENKLARGNLLAAVNNWALALCDAGYFAEAETLLVDGQQFDPNHSAFVHNATHVEQMWAQSQAAAAGALKTGPAMPSL
jgi:tetratricopeptide (TPR) repeat protein